MALKARPLCEILQLYSNIAFSILHTLSIAVQFAHRLRKHLSLKLRYSIICSSDSQTLNQSKWSESSEFEYIENETSDKNQRASKHSFEGTW